MSDEGPLTKNVTSTAAQGGLERTYTSELDDEPMVGDRASEEIHEIARHLVASAIASVVRSEQGNNDRVAWGMDAAAASPHRIQGNAPDGPSTSEENLSAQNNNDDGPTQETEDPPAETPSADDFGEFEAAFEEAPDMPKGVVQ